MHILKKGKLINNRKEFQANQIEKKNSILKNNNIVIINQGSGQRKRNKT